MYDIKKDDYVFHHDNGYLKSISIARCYCYEETKPVEFVDKTELWAGKGYRVDLDYYQLYSQQKTDSIRSFIKHIISELNGDVFLIT